MVKNRENIKEPGKVKREKNLIPFKKGESGNPEGRPVGQRNYATIYREALIKLAKLNDKTPEELEEEILSKALLSARGGNYSFYKDIQDRIHGAATQKTDITTNGKDLPQPILNVQGNNSNQQDTPTNEED